MNWERLPIFLLLTLTSQGESSEVRFNRDIQPILARNCFACHGGTVYGKPVAGAPNNRLALQTLTERSFKSLICTPQCFFALALASA